MQGSRLDDNFSRCGIVIHTPNFDPGINIYPPPAPVQVAFVEGYKDRKAFMAHNNGPNLTKFIAKYGSLFLNIYGPTSPFVIVQALELAVGFIRPSKWIPMCSRSRRAGQ